MASITDLLRDTVKIINEISENNEEVIQRSLGLVIANNSNANASTLERYMTFMNEQIFTKLSSEHPLEDLRRLVPLIEKLVVLVSDDGLSLEQALTVAQEAQAIVAVVHAEMKRPFSFACLWAAGKRILPAARRAFAACRGPAAVGVAEPVVPDAVAEVLVVADVLVSAPSAVQLPTEQPPPATESAPVPESAELREVEPSPSASDNTDQKEEPAN